MRRSPVRIRLPAPNSSETLVFGEFFLLNASLAAERLSQRNGNKIEIVSLPQISCFHVRPTFDPHGNIKRKAPELFQCFLCFYGRGLHGLLPLSCLSQLQTGFNIFLCCSFLYFYYQKQYNNIKLLFVVGGICNSIVR